MTDLRNFVAPFFAIIRNISRYVEGDERSRTNPGHGYPAGYETYTTIDTYTDEAAWKRAIEHSYRDHQSGSALAVRCTPVSVSTKIELKETT